MFYWIILQAVVVAEWLRRWTRNPLGSARAGSNPADYVPFCFLTAFTNKLCIFRSSGDLYTLLKTQIHLKIHDGNFSVDSQGPHQQVKWMASQILQFLVCFTA